MAGSGAAGVNLPGQMNMAQSGAADLTMQMMLLQQNQLFGMQNMNLSGMPLPNVGGINPMLPIPGLLPNVGVSSAA